MRPLEDPLPEGVRQDTRKHTQHCLRPSEEIVAQFLKQPDAAGFRRFRAAYLQLLKTRFRADRSPFDVLVELARSHDVFIGCNCPTQKQPDIEHCHTVLALRFLEEHYPGLRVRRP